MAGSALPKGTVLTLAIVFLVSLIDGLDATIVAVALPTISDEMGVSPSQSSWVIFAYVLGMAMSLIPMGRMAKNGRKKGFLLMGTALFGASSLLCGLSFSFWMLASLRLVQGIAAAMMCSSLPSIIVHMLPADRKGLGMSVIGASAGAAMIAGPVLGGMLTAALSWHWIFFIGVPVSILIIALVHIHIPRDGAPDPGEDPTLTGALSAVAFVGSLLLILEDLGDHGVNVAVRSVCCITAAASLALLVRSIRRDAGRAVVSPGMLRNREYLLVSASFVLCTMVAAGVSYLLPYLLQGYWGMTTLDSSLYISAISVAMIVAVLPVGGICDRRGCRAPTIAAVAASALFCILMVALVAEDAEPALLLAPMAVLGVSKAFSGTAMPTRMVHHATPGCEDEATNFTLVFHYVASALGCATFAAVYAFAEGGIDGSASAQLAEGFTATMWASLALLALAMACALAVRNRVVRAERIRFSFLMTSFLAGRVHDHGDVVVPLGRVRDTLPSAS